MRWRSLPVRGAWVEIPRTSCLWMVFACRSPCGERGLKSPFLPGLYRPARSLPVRGAWVEMTSRFHRCARALSRSPCGERGLKYPALPPSSCALPGRSPCGERGLK